MSVVRKASGMVIRRFALQVAHYQPLDSDELLREAKEHSRVIESSLEPLNTSSHQSVLLNDHQMPRQRANSFTSHRVPLVGHRTRSNLVLLERFLDFFQVREETNVGSDFVSGGSEGSERA